MKVSYAAFLCASASFASASHLVRLSTLGESLALQTPRRLDDISWMSDYHIRYENCFPTKGLVTYRLCPAKGDACKKDSCDDSGEYLIDFDIFIDAFTEAQMGAREYICEQIRENCDQDDEDNCYSGSYAYCKDNYDDDEFSIQEYLECKEFGDNGYYVGPYCSSDDDYSIYFGLYTDDECTVPAEENVYGAELPYSAESGNSIIENPCTKCKEHGKQEDQNYADQEDDDDVLEQCQELYEEASKCETDLDVDNADTSACGYIEELIEEEEVIQAAYVSAGNAENWWHGTGPLWIALAVVVCLVCALQICLLREVQKRDKKVTAANSASKENLI